QPLVRISDLLPNPTGDETQNEQVTLVNKGAAPADLHGWKLRDAANTSWILDSAGSIPAGASLAVRRDGQPMSMNNSGDTIELLDNHGTVLQTVTYGRVAEGEIILVP